MFKHNLIFTFGNVKLLKTFLNVIIILFFGENSSFYFKLLKFMCFIFNFILHLNLTNYVFLLEMRIYMVRKYDQTPLN